MPTPSLPYEVYEETARLIMKHNGVAQAAAKEAYDLTGIAQGTFLDRARKAKHMGLWSRDGEARQPMMQHPVPLAAELPDDDIPTEELIEQMVRRYEKRKAHRDAKLWRRFNVPVKGPYAVMFFGDPHIDDNGCDWPLLHKHCDLARSTEALFAVNIGDTTNNWMGRLARLWAEQDTSSATARKLVKWFFNDSGVPWWLWIQGNHDTWPGPVGSETLERFKPQTVAMEDWGAKVTLLSPCGSEFRIHASHDFPGHSQWNPLHGPMKEAMWGDHAHLYVAGHKHNWALFNGEHNHRGNIFWLARARGYKTIDHYADLHGFGSQNHGHSIVAVVDPGSNGPGHIKCFADPFEGADYLNYKRRR